MMMPACQRPVVPWLSMSDQHFTSGSHLVCQALQEGGLELGHKGLQARPGLGYQQAERVQDGRLDFPSKAVANDADQRPCSMTTYACFTRPRRLEQPQRAK